MQSRKRSHRRLDFTWYSRIGLTTRRLQYDSLSHAPVTQKLVATVAPTLPQINNNNNNNNNNAANAAACNGGACGGGNQPTSGQIDPLTSTTSQTASLKSRSRLSHQNMLPHLTNGLKNDR